MAEWLRILNKAADWWHGFELRRWHVHFVSPKNSNYPQTPDFYIFVNKQGLSPSKVGYVGLRVSVLLLVSMVTTIQSSFLFLF